MNKYEELEKIGELKDKGILTEEDFIIEKNKIMNEDRKKTELKKLKIEKQAMVEIVDSINNANINKQSPEEITEKKDIKDKGDIKNAMFFWSSIIYFGGMYSVYKETGVPFSGVLLFGETLGLMLGIYLLSSLLTLGFKNKNSIGYQLTVIICFVFIGIGVMLENINEDSTLLIPLVEEYSNYRIIEK